MTETSAPGRPGGMRARVASLVLVAVVVGELVALTVLGLRYRDLGEEEDRRASALAAARHAAVTVTSLDHTRLAAQFDTIGQLSTGRFRAEFQRNEELLRRELVGAKAVHVSTVREAGLAELAGDRATVVVALDDTVKTAKAPKGRTLPYRMLLSLLWRDGRWLVDNLRPVA